MLKKSISYLTMSDIHLGHSRNKTENIINNLKLYFHKHRSILDKIDILFIDGDIYDKLLASSSREYVLIIEWLTWLVNWCIKRNVKLRILKGTPSHDWDQLDVLNSILEGIETGLDFKYINKVHIEVIEEYNLSILYIPDEWNEDPLVTLKEAKELMKALNLIKVDVVHMHGQFHYQIPQIILENSHSEDLYLDIVKYYIHVGHIHTYSVFDRIIANGSFDRLAHNEEEDKGAVVTYLNRSGKSSFLFIPNEHATIFKTIRVYDNELDLVISDVFKKTKEFADGSKIRIVMTKDNEVRKSFSIIKEKFKRFALTIKVLKEEEVEEKVNLHTVTGLKITKDNVEKLLMDELVKHNLSNLEIGLAKEELVNLI